MDANIKTCNISGLTANTDYEVSLLACDKKDMDKRGRSEVEKENFIMKAIYEEVGKHKRSFGVKWQVCVLRLTEKLIH